MPDPDGVSRGFHPGQQFLEILRRQIRRRRKRRSGGVDQADGGEILDRIELEIRIKRHARRQRHLMDHERVAVGRGTGAARGADHAAGAADVFDHDRLAERLLHAVLQDARDRVGRAARRERHQQRDGTVGIGLRRSGAGCQKTRGEKRRRERACEVHESSLKPPVVFCCVAAADIFARFSALPQDGHGLDFAGNLVVSRLSSAAVP